MIGWFSPDQIFLLLKTEQILQLYEKIETYTSLKNVRIAQHYYLNTLANLTLNILFSELLKISKIISSKSKNIVKDNSDYLRI